jgi:acetoacetyl-CoA synthetase
MDVAVFDEDGNESIGQAGELVCRNAFPSMPIGFWNDPENERYRSTYFERFANTWWHGDWSLQSENGGFTIYGRSDATLNPGGVRIGTAEIYRQIETIPEVAEAVATALRQDGDERIVLFVKLRGDAQWSDGLVASMKDRLRHHCSPRHVPAWVVEAPDLPRTISGKLSEIAVRNAISGQSIGNAGALANPESLSFFQQWRKTLDCR